MVVTETVDLTGELDDSPPTKVARRREDASFSARGGEARAGVSEGSDTPSPPPAPKRDVVNTVANDDDDPLCAMSRLRLAHSGAPVWPR